MINGFALFSNTQPLHFLYVKTQLTRTIFGKLVNYHIFYRLTDRGEYAFSYTASSYTIKRDQIARNLWSIEIIRASSTLGREKTINTKSAASF